MMILELNILNCKSYFLNSVFEDKTSFEDGAISCIESENWLGAVRPRFVLVNAGIEHDIIGLCLILSELGLAIKDPDKAHTS
jgi:hypothetical protein